MSAQVPKEMQGVTVSYTPEICSIKGCDKGSFIRKGNLNFCKEHGEELGLLLKPLPSPDLNPEHIPRTIFIG